MKQLKVLLMLLGILTLTSCSLFTTTEYIDRPYKVLVEVPCEVKKVHCDINGTDAEVVLGLTKCIIDLKKEASVCNGNIEGSVDGTHRN